MDQATDNGTAGGSGYTGSEPESKEPSTENPTSDKSTEEAGDNLDDLGYAKIEPEGEAEPKKEAVKEEKPKEAEPEKEVEPITKYDQEPKEEPKKEVEPEKKPEEKADEKPEEVTITDTGDLNETEITDIKDFVKTHGFTQKQAQALVEKEKERVKKINESITDQEIQAKEARVAKDKEWIAELKTDATFGGENFAHNVKQVDKVIDQFFPNMKKALTEVDVLLPPYVMRDLSNVAKHLFKTENLVQGEVGKEDKSDDNKEDSHLDFYS